jgi:hypothetical protein
VDEHLSRHDLTDEEWDAWFRRYRRIRGKDIGGTITGW